MKNEETRKGCVCVVVGKWKCVKKLLNYLPFCRGCYCYETLSCFATLFSGFVLAPFLHLLT